MTKNPRKTLKLYSQDHGSNGLLIAIAYSEEEAREMWKGEYTYRQDTKVEEHKLKHGLTVTNYGDV